MKLLFLGYDGCTTCKNAKKWLAARGVSFDDRAIVTTPPTASELARWVPASGLPLRKWLNTSGQSYRALGKAVIDGFSEAELTARLTQDGKLVKRPVLVVGDPATPTKVLVGFSESAYADVLAR